MSMSCWAHARPLPRKMADKLRFEYLWQDAENFKRPTKMPAPEYIEHLMTWVQGNIDDEKIFPSRIGKLACFSRSIRPTCNCMHVRRYS
jgi:Mob1/phocein family